MGSPKAFLPAGWRTLIEETIRPAAGLFDEVLIGVSPGQSIPNPPGRPVEDEVAGQGPLRGILTGLRAAAHDACFILGCDMPGLQAGVIRKIAARSESADVAIAVTGPDLKEPLLGVYKKSAVPAIEALLAAGERSVLALSSRVRVIEVPLSPEEMPRNINTRDEYESWLRERGRRS